MIPCFQWESKPKFYNSQQNPASPHLLPLYPLPLLLPTDSLCPSPRKAHPTWGPLQWLFPLWGALFPQMLSRYFPASPPSSLCLPVPISMSHHDYPVQHCTQCPAHTALSIPLILFYFFFFLTPPSAVLFNLLICLPSYSLSFPHNPRHIDKSPIRAGLFVLLSEVSQAARTTPDTQMGLNKYLNDWIELNDWTEV